MKSKPMHHSSIRLSIRQCLISLLCCLSFCLATNPPRIFGCFSRCGNANDAHPLQPGAGGSRPRQSPERHPQRPREGSPQPRQSHESDASQTPPDIVPVSRISRSPSDPRIRWPDPLAGPQRIRVSGTTAEFDYVHWLYRPATRQQELERGRSEHMMPLVIPYFEEIGRIVFYRVRGEGHARVQIRIPWLDLDAQYFHTTQRLLDRVAIAISLHQIPAELALEPSHDGHLPRVEPIVRHYPGQEYIMFQYDYDYVQEGPRVTMNPMTYSLIDLWNAEGDDGPSLVRYHYTVVWFDSPRPPSEEHQS